MGNRSFFLELLARLLPTPPPPLAVQAANSSAGARTERRRRLNAGGNRRRQKELPSSSRARADHRPHSSPPQQPSQCVTAFSITDQPAAQDTIGLRARLACGARQQQVRGRTSLRRKTAMVGRASGSAHRTWLSSRARRAFGERDRRCGLRPCDDRAARSARQRLRRKMDTGNMACCLAGPSGAPAQQPARGETGALISPAQSIQMVAPDVLNMPTFAGIMSNGVADRRG